MKTIKFPLTYVMPDSGNSCLQKTHCQIQDKPAFEKGTHAITFSKVMLLFTMSLIPLFTMCEILGTYLLLDLLSITLELSKLSLLFLLISTVLFKWNYRFSKKISTHLLS